MDRLAVPEMRYIVEDAGVSVLVAAGVPHVVPPSPATRFDWWGSALLTLALVSYTDTYSPAVSVARFTAPRELLRDVPNTYCRKYQ